MFRYCDDVVICCQNQRDAERVKKGLANRLTKYKLKMNEEKTRFVLFSKRKFRQGERQGTFDFLGFTNYLGLSRRGTIIPKIRTSGQRFRSKLKRVNQWAKSIRNKAPLNRIWELFCSKIRGHIQYYGVSHNCAQINIFLQGATRIVFKWLNRRSQRKSFTWESFRIFMKKNPIPEARIAHRMF